MLKVLMVSSECAPFSKTGGLADVAGSLPKALLDHGVDVRVITPLYGSVPQKYKEKFVFKKQIWVNVGWRRQYCGIFEYKLDGVIFYFLDNEYYFKRDKIYGHTDEAEIYSFFCRAALEALGALYFPPHVIHCHDWQTGMIPVLLEAQYRHWDLFKDTKTLFTIHNLKYQGIFPKTILNELLGLGDQYFTPDSLEYNGNISFMKGGLIYSSLLSTVSPSYALEIQTEYYGEGLDGVLRAKKNLLSGILNGIDYDEYNPETDLYIYSTYGIGSLERKIENKLKLQEQLGILVSPDIPLIGIVSRLTPQKGLDLVTCVAQEIISAGAELVVLGTGSPEIENAFVNLAEQYKGRVSANIAFNNELSHKIYAGADLFLMPSLFEPCGLGQMIALRYGTPPIVRETGGLKDTVMPYNELASSGNGFSFTNYNAHDMLFTIKRALSFYKNKPLWNTIVKNAMSCDLSWDSSSLKYITLYESLK